MHLAKEAWRRLLWQPLEEQAGFCLEVLCLGCCLNCLNIFYICFRPQDEQAEAEQVQVEAEQAEVDEAPLEARFSWMQRI